MTNIYDWETFRAAYGKASSVVKSLVDSDVVPLCVDRVTSEYSLSLELRPSLIVLTVNKILGLADENDTLNFLLSKQTPLAQAQAIVTALDSCLFEYSDAQRQSVEMELMEKELESITSIDNLKNTQPPEPVHISTQSAILQGSKSTVSTTPSPQTQPTRWETQ